jgi:geranylgeranyl pyrophosphate synthase|tara:strand:+ start:90 stop:983 length:894 start_codon:yes stop_codon:yes gene_type:complete
MSHTPVFFSDYRDLIDDQLKTYINEFSYSDVRLAEAIQYSTLLGGKRIRPILTLATAKCVGTPIEGVLPYACATELIHAYSLIHDDLPAMDNDQLRRGQPTCHIAFNEATAILAGDALQTMAFELIANKSTLSASKTLKIIQILTKASGARGMVYGQALDFDSVGKQLDLATLEKMHRHKTGILIEASVTAGALTSKTDLLETELNLFKKYGQAIGLAFQVQDDILDIISDTTTLGKTQGADKALNKPTYPALLGLDGAKNKLYGLHDEALACLSGLGRFNTHQLAQISHFIVERIR